MMTRYVEGFWGSHLVVMYRKCSKSFSTLDTFLMVRVASYSYWDSCKVDGSISIKYVSLVSCLIPAPVWVGVLSSTGHRCSCSPWWGCWPAPTLLDHTSHYIIDIGLIWPRGSHSSRCATPCPHSLASAGPRTWYWGRGRLDLWPIYGHWWIYGLW